MAGSADSLDERAGNMLGDVELRYPKPGKLDDRFVLVGSSLLDSLKRVVIDVHGGTDRPQDFARSLAINKDISSRLLSALRTDDPFVAVHRLPGSEALLKVLDAAKKNGGAKSDIVSAREAIEDFNRFIRIEVGDRGALDAFIGSTVPEVRKRTEMTSKQSMFKGASSLYGQAAEAAFITFLLHPSEEHPDRCDTMMLGGVLGLRRITRDAEICFTSVLLTDNRDRELLGDEIDGTPSPVIRELSTPVDIPIRAIEESGAVRYVVDSLDIGLKSTCDLFLGEFYPGVHPVHPGEGDNPKPWFYATIEQPVKAIVLDVHLHKDIWSGVTPEILTYDTSIGGVVNRDDPRRETRRIRLHEDVAPLGFGVNHKRSTDLGGYPDVLQRMCARRGWDADEFRGYRCRVAYPIYGSQICMEFAFRRD